MKCYANLIAIVVITTIANGCASYVAPGRAADLAAMGERSPAAIANSTDPTVRSGFDRKPLATFPAAIAVARVQAPGYVSRTNSGFGSGAFSVVTTRDIEKPEHFDRLAKMPSVKGIAPMNRLLLPPLLMSDADLRQAASTLRAEMLLIYTLDTTFRVDEKARPISVVSLGLFPNRRAHVICTASAVLMDTRNGYIYGVAESTEKVDQLASAWTSEEAVDESRRRAETRAFDKLVGELESTWRGVVDEYATVK